MKNNDLTLFGYPFGEPFDLMFNRLSNPFVEKEFNEMRLNNGFVEYDDNYTLNIVLPVVGDSLKVEVENGSLEVSYDEKTENGYHKGSYKYSLPENAEATAIKAELGTLTNDKELVITLPKKKNLVAKGPRQIDVTVK